MLTSGREYRFIATEEKNMNFTEIAEKRQSCRSYDATRSVENEKLDRILEAARLSPSACNGQPYFITVCKGETAKKVASIHKVIFAAYITAEATAQGLGTCILGWLDDADIREICDLDGAVRLVITLGYAKADDKLRVKKRKDMNELIKIID